MYDIITFGTGTQDIYMKSKKFLIKGKDICVSIGSKVAMEDLFFYSGGGGTNTAATFANQGLKTAFCGMLGEDCFGNLIVSELKKLKIDTALIQKTKNKSTATSVFLAYPGQDRTILVYRGASDDLTKKDIPWRKIKNSRWFYLSPFSGNLANLTEDLINFAKKNKIKVAWNPGYDQLNFSRPVLEDILRKIDVLILNREEASQLTEIPHKRPARIAPATTSKMLAGAGGEKEIFQEIDKMTKGIAIMTKGEEGAVISDGRYLYRAKSLGFKLVDGTGAGDSFGSGFVAGLIQKDDIVYAIQLAMANSGYNITKWGAKEGLLKKSQKWPKVKVGKELVG